MSTIAQPRDTSVPRRLPSSATPSSSTRPSMDGSRSQTSSPVPGSVSAFTPQPPSFNPTSSKRANRAALREFYNLRKASSASVTPTVEVSSPPASTTPDGRVGHGLAETSEVPFSEMDATGFEPEVFVKKATAERSMEELLRLYTRTLGEIRALDAEKKALVYDNYSKLISATETIRKMRTNMDPLNPMASTLDPALAQIYSQAAAIRDNLREKVPGSELNNTAEAATEDNHRKSRTKQLALEVLETPNRMRTLTSDGRSEDAREMWKRPRKLLEVWKQKGLGGDAVQTCIEDGDAALKGELDFVDWRTTNAMQKESDGD